MSIKGGPHSRSDQLQRNAKHGKVSHSGFRSMFPEKKMQQGLSIIVDGEEGMLQKRLYFFFWSMFAKDSDCCFGFCLMFCLVEIARVADGRAFSPIYQGETDFFMFARTTLPFFLFSPKKGHK